MNAAQKHILVVEDDHDIQQMISLYLHDSGYKVHFVTTAKEMYAFFKAEPPVNLVLLDLGLPDADGLDLAEQIRAFSPVPIFVLTARMEREARLTALGVGADDYLTKPFDPEELRLRIQNLLSRIEINAQDNADEDSPKRALSLGRAALFVVGIIAVIGLGVGLYSAWMSPAVDYETAKPPETLRVSVSIQCRATDAVFMVTNTGERWPGFGEVRIYRVASQTVLFKRRLRLAQGQSASFNVKLGNVGPDGVGMWVKPEWYERAFKYDASANCR